MPHLVVLPDERQLPVIADPQRLAALGLWPWLLAWLALVLLDGTLDVGSLAQLLVMAAAFCALWWPWWAALGISALSVLLFNYAFVPPRGTFSVALHQHVLLLFSTLALSALVALLMQRLRSLAHKAHWLANCSERQRLLAGGLRETEHVSKMQAQLAQALAELARVSEATPGPHAAFLGMWNRSDRVPPSFNSADRTIYKKGAE